MQMFTGVEAPTKFSSAESDVNTLAQQILCGLLRRAVKRFHLCGLTFELSGPEPAWCLAREAQHRPAALRGPSAMPVEVRLERRVSRHCLADDERLHKEIASIQPTTNSVATMSSNPPAAAGPPHFAHKKGQASAATTPAIAADNCVGRMFKALGR